MASFEVLGLPSEEDRSAGPGWVRHLALRVSDREALLQYKQHLEAHGVSVLGSVDHEFRHSIYFVDPNGIRLELTWDLRDFAEEDATVAAGAVEAWNRRTR